jgi:hypothetical protein
LKVGMTTVCRGAPGRPIGVICGLGPDRPE